MQYILHWSASFETILMVTLTLQPPMPNGCGLTHAITGQGQGLGLGQVPGPGPGSGPGHDTTTSRITVKAKWIEAKKLTRCHAFATRRPGWQSIAMGTSFGLKYTTLRYGGPGRWPHHRIFVMSTQIGDHLLSSSSSTRRPCE